MSKINGRACVANGRNLYLNSKLLEDSYGRNDGAKVTVEPFDSDTNMWHIVADKGAGGSVGIYLYNYAGDKLPDTSDWSYSADVKGTGKVARFGIEAGNRKQIVGTVGSEWSRISQTGHFDNINHKTIIMYFDTTDSPVDVYIKLPKLELGTTATPLTPAPVDKVFSNGRQVYGRNLIADSGFESGNTPANYNWGDGGSDARDFRVHGEAESLPSPMSKFMLQIGNYSSDSTLKQDQYVYYPIKPVIIRAGETWTYSYYYASAGSAGGQASDYLMADRDSPIWQLSMGHNLRDTSGGQTTWHRFSKTFTAGADVNVKYLRFGFIKTYATTGGWVCIDNIKLEKSSVATPWSPAPEDILK